MALTKAKASNILLTTPVASSNDTTPATTQYVTTAINNLIDGAPATLNTLDEIAAALNDDAALNTTLTNAIAAKLPLAGGTMTGNLTVNSAGGVYVKGGGGLRLEPTDGSDTDAWILYQYNDNTLRYNFTGAGADEIIIKHPAAANTTTLEIDTANVAVGIGKTSPLAGALDVAGKLNVLSGSSALRFEEYNNGATIWLDGSNGDFSGADYWNISANGTTDLRFGYSTAAQLRILANGNVGINSSASNAKLEVVATSGEILRADANGGLGVLIANQTHLYANKLAIGHTYSTSNNMGDVKLQLGNNYAFGGAYSAFGENLNSQSTIVGNNIRPVIGTNNQVMRHYNGSDAGNFMKIAYNKGVTFHTGLTNTQGTGFSEDTNERMRIHTGGNVGIGTDNPLKKLHIVGGGYDQIMINSSSGNNTNRLSGISGINYTGNQFSFFQNFSQNGSTITYYGSADGAFKGINSHKFYVAPTIDSSTTTLGLDIASTGQVRMPKTAAFESRGASGNWVTLSAGGWQDIGWVELNDANGNLNSVTYSGVNTVRFTAPHAGYYIFNLNYYMRWNGTAAQAYVHPAIFINGAYSWANSVSPYSIFGNAASVKGNSDGYAKYAEGVTIARIIYMASGDYAEPKLYTNGSAWQNYANYNYFAGGYLSG